MPDQLINKQDIKFKGGEAQIHVYERKAYSTEVLMGGTFEGKPFVGTFVIREGRDAIDTEPRDERTEEIAMRINVAMDEANEPTILSQEISRILD